MSIASVRAVVALSALAAALLSGASCGPRSFAARAVPFPAEKPLFADAAGNPLKNLPPCVEPVRLVFVDAPWCPPCADAWKAIRDASALFPRASVRVYRVLFDREQFLAKEGPRQAPPLSAAEAVRPGDVPVTALTALPGPFREQFRLDQFPVLLLMDRDGAVVRRWTGASPTLEKSVAEAVNGLWSSLPRPGT